MQFRDLQRQYTALKGEIDPAVAEVMRSGAFIMGTPVNQLEQELSEYVGVRHVLTCANGTDALTLALTALGIGPGDAVFVPDFTFFATAETVAQTGATPVFVDVERTTFNMAPSALLEALTEVQKAGQLVPRAVIGVDLFGLPARWIALNEIAHRWNMYTIEDGAQGFGGRIGEQRACSFADIATTSFFPAKPLGCYGDGGAVFTNNDQWAALIASLRIHGKGSNKYDNVRLGFNSRLDTIQAALLRVKLKAFHTKEYAAVNQVAELYERLLDTCDGLICPHLPEQYGSSWAQYTLILDTRIDRDRLQQTMREKGIPTMVYYPKRMSDQTAFHGVHHYVETPVAKTLCDNVLSLPIDPYKRDDEIEYVAATLKEALKGNRK